MKIISVTLVAAGIFLLFLSLFPTRKICLREYRISKGWKAMGLLIICLILGYSSFGIMVLNRPGISVLHLIVALVLFGGSVFVISVVIISRKSIDYIEHLAEQERLRALHDELTGLPNRLMFIERLDYALLMAKRKRDPTAILLMDLVKFKEINDSLGHFYGDYLLQEVSARLGKVVRKTDTLARFGGDEFALVLPPLTTLEQAVKVVQKIGRALDEPFLIEGHKLKVGISIGIAMYPEHGGDSETLIQHADIAMYEAKRNDVTYTIFDSEQDQSAWNRLVLIGELREAIAKSQFFLHYQPKISARDGHIAGVEALVRWLHPRKGRINPEQFIPLAEQAGLSKHLTNWVLDNALKQAAEWHKAGISLSISVNLSVKNLHDLEFPYDVVNLLKKWDLDPSFLILEITESSMMMNPERVNRVVAHLEELGINLSIDDYGTGYSSLAYIRRFPAREIKIDKAFIMDMLHNEDNTVIVRSTIEMVHTMGCKVVAEGVEDEETRQMLVELGCDFLQGFHICRPLAADKFQSWLDSGTDKSEK
ncbi:MAG: putative bifunctional diguanylate cyclase/phosphodiesterase [Desulfurivibrionaceae bacterium]